MSKEITRKDFLKKAACLAACPFFFNAVASSCGPVGGVDSGSGDGLISGGEGNFQRIELSSYKDLAVGSAKSLTLPDSQKILLLKKSEDEFYAFEPRCPHEGEPVVPISGSSLGRCTEHGALFDLNGKATTGPAADIQGSLTYYAVTKNSDHLLVDMKAA